MLDIKRVIASAPRKPEQVTLQTLFTPWGEQLEGEMTHHHHPHPQFERASFVSLDGWWDYCFQQAQGAESQWRTAAPPATYEGRIRVPFSPEAPLSGVQRQLTPRELLWYRCVFSCFEADDASQKMLEEPFCDAKALLREETQRLLLHFEAVDYACACYVNGQRVGEHVGGYLPFSFDITDALIAGENEICVCVHDPSDAGVQLRGKQSLQRGGIWYTAQSGIWQTVWLEMVPNNHMTSLDVDAQASGRLSLKVTVQSKAKVVDDAAQQDVRAPSSGANPADDLPILEAYVYDADTLVASATCSPSVSHGADDTQRSHTDACTFTSAQDDDVCTAELVMHVPQPHLWSPDDPHLYRIELTYGSDRVSSYAAFRSVSVKRDKAGVARFYLNDEPLFLRGVLDQGYWSDGLMTAPTDEALVFDIQTMKDLGFNMLRKHIKVECDRWYYHCDRLGMLVWQDMVCGGDALRPWHTSYKPTFFRSSWGRCNDESSRRHAHFSASAVAFRDEWRETCAHTIRYLKSHPSIVTWVLFNEAWGQFNARAATRMVRELDPTRPIDAVSGWYDQRCGDFLSVHNYFRPLAVYKDRAHTPRAFVISEFGGLSFYVAQHCVVASSYGYDAYDQAQAFRAAVREVLQQADNLEAQGLAGFVYTQLSDVEEETNGILTYDRRVNKLLDGDVQ